MNVIIGKQPIQQVGKRPSRKGKIVLLFFVMLIQMFSIFATDMYLPALPGLTAYFNTSESLVNLTLMAYFLFSMIGMLFFGALSDKYGRKPILLIGTATFVIMSVACALSTTIGELIAFRIFQSIAAGAVNVVGTAIVKDCFAGKTRENVLFAMQAAFVLGPIMAPVVGAQILLFYTWQITFYLLAALGFIGFIMSVLFKESLALEQRYQGTTLGSLTGLAVVAKNRTFMVFMLGTTAYCGLAFIPYLTVSSYIYEGFFGLSAQQFSYFFAANAAFSVLGIALFKFLERWVSIKTITTGLIGLAIVCGASQIFFGSLSPFAFFICILIYNIETTMARPYSTNILLDLQKDEAGSASAVINCSLNLMGLIGLIPLMLIGGNYIIGLGFLIMTGALISAVFWVYFLRSKLTVAGVKE